jgi:methylphosphotriester-DNA--protein-cysteine methyltransferase
MMKPVRKVFFALFIGSVVAVSAWAASANTTVYITKTGGKYHVASCSSLRKSKIAISLGDAVRRGYGPCGRCHPPLLSD